MKILLTGARGQIGSEIVKRLPNIIAYHKDELDVSDIHAIRQKVEQHKPGIIINCAAYTAVDKAESEPDKVFLINKAGPENLAKICEENKIFLIHISTDYVFDGTKKSPYIETDRANSQSVYGLSKWQGEEAVRNHCKNHLILRVSWVFGEYGHNFVKTMLRLSKERDELKIVDDQIGCPTYAGDIADVLLHIAKHPKIGTYHYCGKPVTNWFEFAKVILKDNPIKIIPIKTTDYPTPAKRPQNSVLNCDLFIKTFKMELSEWQNGLKHVK
ncbi:MAG TPA: dTDP-4-dehydrorhamnose reductase [Gammaproteobacteria bacterium]|nr:dTDP-4-dehydrorhamnose reductase [Gammaproteobacteria bacterium]